MTSLLEIGVRRQLIGKSLLAVGVGAGVGAASPRLQLLTGVEVPF